jgi:NhaP-type Na+/H+ and K+/H+ antiporter
MSDSEPKIIAVRVHFKNYRCNLHLQDISLPEHCYVLSIIRQGKIILASNDLLLCEQDLIIIVAIYPMVFPELLVSLRQHFWLCSWLETTPVSWSKPYQTLNM